MLRLAAALAGLSLFASAAVHAADSWTVDPDASELTWTVPFSGNPLPGRFLEFTSDIRFDPGDLEGSAVSIAIPITSVEAANDEQTAELQKPDWFDAETHPMATFTADSFRSLGDDAYEADGILTIRDQAHPITLPFSFVIDGDTAHISGGTTIDRIDYGVGQGDWAIDDIVGFDVAIAFDLTAVRAP